MTAPARFTQADVTRLIRGAIAAGIRPDAIRLTVRPDGELVLSASGGPVEVPYVDLADVWSDDD